MRYIISLCLASLLTLPASAEVPRVVTDIPPVQSLVAQVMGDLGQPDVLLEQGANAHSFQLRPSQAHELAEADLIIWVGPEMTPWLDRTLNGLAVEASQLRLLGVPGTALRGYAKTDAHADHDDDAHADTDSGDDPDHHHRGTDPHAWLAPGNAQVWLAAIAQALATFDPEHQATYAANAARAQHDLAALDTRLQTILAPAKGKPILVFHDAYGYFAAHFGLTLAGALAMGDAAPPGAAHLRAVQEGLTGTTLCIFPETNHDPKLVASIADGTRVRIGGALDPEGSSLPEGPGLYAALLEDMAQTIADCLSP